jgi:hypothetical protein
MVYNSCKNKLHFGNAIPCFIHFLDKDIFQNVEFFFIQKKNLLFHLKMTTTEVFFDLYQLKIKILQIIFFDEILSIHGSTSNFIFYYI